MQLGKTFQEDQTSSDCGKQSLRQKKSRGRPSTGFDKKAYMKEYMRKRRAKSLHTPYPVDENTTTK